jgi:hypothetical protein
MSDRYEIARRDFDAALEAAGDDLFKHYLVQGLSNLTLQLQSDIGEIRQRLDRLAGAENQK